MSTFNGAGPDPTAGTPAPPTRNGASPSDDRRSAYGASSRGGERGYYDSYDRGRDWDEYERRGGMRGRSRSPPFDEGRRKRRSSFSPSDRERYEPRPRYDDDYRGGGRARSPPRGGDYRSSRYPDPYDAECPVPMRAYVDWFQHTHPDEFAEDERATAEATQKGESTLNVGLKGRYEKYRKQMIAKQMDLMFRYHTKSPWFNEKYNPAPPFVNLRLRVRRDGWTGLIDKFVSEVSEGKHDPPVAPVVEPEPAPADKNAESSGDADAEADGAGDESMMKVEDEEREEKEEDATHNERAEGEGEEPKSPKPEQENGGENGATNGNSARAEEDGEGAEGDKPAATKDRPEATALFVPREQLPKDDEVVAEPEGNQVLIRTIPPDIGRVKLEKICRSVPGFIHLALGDTMQKRNYYRAGWLKFAEDCDMTSVIDRLGEEKIEGFKLHVTHSTRPFAARPRYAPETCRRPDRIIKDLANIKKLAYLLENEAAELRKLPEKLPEFANLPKSQGGDLPDEPAAKKEGEGEGENGDAGEGAGESFNINDVKKEQQASEMDEMAVDDDPREPKNRGSAAVEERLRAIYAERGLDGATKPDADADGDAPMTDDAAIETQKNDIALELYLSYLRTAFNCCYYCSAVTDHVEELQRKCIKHIRRRPAKSQEPQRDERWEESLDQKSSLLIDRDNVDPREHGGKSIAEETTKAVEQHIKQEDEGKFRCKTCSKLFKAMSFVEKHVTTKHSELVKPALEDIPFYNNFALDPHKIQPFTHVPPPNTNGQSAPPEAFGLRTAPQVRGNGMGGMGMGMMMDGGMNMGRPRGNSYNSGYGPPPPPYAMGGPGYYPPPPPGYDPYYRDYYYPPPPMPMGMPMHPGYPPPPPGRGYGGGGRSPPRGGRLSDRLGGFVNSYDQLPPRPEMGGGGGDRGGGRGGRGRRDGGGPVPENGGAPPPGAREDPRAAAGRKVSYYDIDRTAEGDVELTY